MKTNRQFPETIDHPLRLRVVQPALIALLLCTLAGCTTNKNLQPAQATPQTGAGGFELADANHDGKLSPVEASDFLTGEIFSAKDTNHDGNVTKQEWTAGDPSATADFKKRDANHDGVVSKDEAVKYSQTRGMTKKAFSEADKNHDGSLDRTEVQAYYASREGSPR